MTIDTEFMGEDALRVDGVAQHLWLTRGIYTFPLDAGTQVWGSLVPGEFTHMQTQAIRMRWVYGTPDELRFPAQKTRSDLFLKIAGSVLFCWHSEDGCCDESDLAPIDARLRDACRSHSLTDPGLMSTQPAPPPSTIVPFWNRLREITLYPAHMGSMITIVILAICQLVIFLPGMLIPLVLVLLVTVAMYKYAFECLRATANGNMEPPEIGVSVDASLGWKQIWLMLILIVVAAFGARLLHPVLAIALIVFIGFSLPGATMTLAMDQSLGSALNPLRWISICTRIGWSYLALVFLCLVIFLSEAYAAALVQKFLPRFVAVVAVAFVSNYAVVVMYHLMGYLIYQYHDAVGFEPAAPQLARLKARPDPDQELLDQVGALVREGKPEAATEMLRGHLRSRGGTDSVHTQYRKLLRLTDDKTESLRHGQEYLNILLAQDKDRLALDILRECQTLDPAFAPTDAEQVTRLAHKAAQLGQPQVALRLLSGFHKRFPKSREIPRNYLLVANLLHERMNEDDKACGVLQYLKTSYPEHALLPEIDAQLALIQRIMAAAGSPKAGTQPAKTSAP